LIEITVEVHIVNYFKIKMLIGVDIIGIEKMVIDFVYRLLILGNVSGFRTDIYVHTKDNVKVRRIIKVVKDAVILPHSVMEMFIKMKEKSGSFTNDRDYFF